MADGYDIGSDGQGGAENTGEDLNSQTTEQNTDTQEQSRGNPNLDQNYKHLQEAYRQSREELKGLKGQFESLNPQLDAVRKLESVFKEKAQEKNFWQALPDDYASKAEQLTKAAQELETIKRELGETKTYLAAQAEEREFKAFDDMMLYSENNPDGIYRSKAELDLAKQLIKEKVPNALEQWSNGRSLKSLHDEMIGAEYSNPNSKLVASIRANALRAQNRKSSNYIDSSRGFGGADGSGGDDDLISVVPSQPR